MFEKLVVFSLFSVGNKRKIIITQEDISGREMWKWNSWERKLRNKHLGGRDGEDEFRERNLGEKLGE